MTNAIIHSMEDATKPTESVSKRLFTILVSFLVLTAISGFALPPIWRLDSWPSCEMHKGVVVEKGSRKIGIYTEHYVILDNNETVWISPATSIAMQEGRSFNYPICRSHRISNNDLDTYCG